MGGTRPPWNEGGRAASRARSHSRSKKEYQGGKRRPFVVCSTCSPVGSSWIYFDRVADKAKCAKCGTT
eukprot:7132971-Pyramimonas_sp.AAC.1